MLHNLTESDYITGEDYVSSLKDYAEKSPAIQHPLLRAIALGDFRDLPGTITRFLREYYFYSYHFTQYLTAVMSRLERPEHRSMLMPNVMEENGQMDEEHKAELLRAGIEPSFVAAPHPELFRRFLAAIGLSREQILQQPPHLATLAWVDTFNNLCRHGSQEQAIGALGLGTEGIVRHVYLELLQGIKKAWPQMTLEQRVFFDLHAHLDDEHAHVMRIITIELCQTVAGRRRVAMGVLQSLNARRTFFDHMLVYLRAMDQGAQEAA
jgi:pyrroloquinoline-quinone synthase